MYNAQEALEALKKISEHQVTGLMFHAQMADFYDFLGFKGFKRMHDYHYLKESNEMRSIHRYAINHCNYIIFDEHTTNPDAIPMAWKNVNRMQVTNDVRRQYAADGFNKWLEWERKTRELYSSCYVHLIESGHVHTAHKVMSLVKDVEMEIKGLERRIIEMKMVDYDLKVLEPMQHKIHDYYKNKKRHL